MFLVIYLLSVFIALFTIPVFIDKEIGLGAGLFVLFTPVINIIWSLYCLIKVIIENKDNFIKDLKKLFNIK